MLASQITGKVDLDWTTVQIRKLSARNLRKAVEARQVAYAATVARLKDALKSLDSEEKRPAAESGAKPTPPAPPTPEQLDAIRYNTYDREKTLELGITGGLPEPLAKSIEDLTAEDEDLVFKAIVDLSVPRPAEAEAAAKNA